MPVKTTKRVAVIGAGPAGAIAADALAKEQAFDTVRVFERRAEVGGTWVYTPHLPVGIPSLEDLLSGDADRPVPIPESLPATTYKSPRTSNHQYRFSDTAIHNNLHSNIDPRIMTFTQEPFPDTLSETSISRYGPQSPFRHREVIREWIESIFTRGGNEGVVELSTTVERAVKNEDGEWVLTLRKESPARDHWWEEKFDSLVVASGHYNVPWLPNVPGMIEYEKRFPGRIIHSKHFRDASDFKGKRVIVIGGSVSSHEVLHEILPVAEHPVYSSLRSGPYKAYGWAPFKHPHLTVKKPISRYDAETGTIFFEDGSRVDDVDHIIYGTGFSFSFPFLPHVQERVKKAYRRLPGVYQHTWDIEDPSLAFVGLLGGGFTFRVYEWQAVAVARRLAGRGKPLPPIEEQREWERERVARLKGGKEYYSISSDFEGFFEFLRHIAGDPEPGTLGRVLPPFDRKLLKTWTGMYNVKIDWFERQAKRAAEEIQNSQGEQKEDKSQDTDGEEKPLRAKL